jgi:GntR family transcriptional regulator
VFNELNKSDLKGVPLYVQISEKIREKIKKNDLEVGAFLPAETELAEMFSVSRMTVRSAIDDLVLEGLLIRKQGTGTIVASKRVERDYSRLTGFYEDMKARGMNPSSKLLKIEEESASEYYAEKLMVPVGSPLFHVLRMRYVENNDIVALHSLHISQHLCPWIADANLSRDSLYELYNKNDVPVEWGKQLVEARSASSEIAEYLDIEVGAPILYTERVSYTKNNVPLEHAVGWCRADRYTMNLSLRR